MIADGHDLIAEGVHHLHLEVSAEDCKVRRALVVVPGIHYQHVVLAVLGKHLLEILGAAVYSSCAGSLAGADLLYLGVGVIGMQDHQVLGGESGCGSKEQKGGCRGYDIVPHFHNLSHLFLVLVNDYTSIGLVL